MRGTVNLARDAANEISMGTPPSHYRGSRLPPELIASAVGFSHRFCLSVRDVAERLAERGITVSDEAGRQWGLEFGPEFARKLRHRQGRSGDTWHLDEGAPRTHSQIAGVWCSAGDEGRPLGAGLQEQAPNPFNLQASRALVGSVEEKVCEVALCWGTFEALGNTLGDKNHQIYWENR